MCGWLSAAAARASCSKRSRRSGIGGELLGQHLDRHLAAQAGVLGEIHLAHPTSAELLHNLVGAEPSSAFHGPGRLCWLAARPQPDARAEAIEAAIPGARVVHLEPDDLVTMAEIAHRTGRTRESVRLLVKGERGPGGFPPPATHFKTRNTMWEWQEVAAWFAETLDEKPLVADSTESGFIVAFNAGLRLRRAEGKLGDADRQRIRRLLG